MTVTSIIIIYVDLRFAPELVDAPWYVTIKETQTLNEEILTISATDQDSSPPHNQFIFSTLFDLQWFGVYSDGRVYVKQVGFY